MIARGSEWLGEFSKNTLPAVLDFTGLAVEKFGSANDFAAEGSTDGLMTKADTEDGTFSCQFFDKLDRNTRFLRSAGAGRDNDAFWFATRDFFDRNFIVAMDFYRAAKFAEILGEVVGKGIVVVEEKNHLRLFFAAAPGDLATACGAFAGAFAALR